MDNLSYDQEWNELRNRRRERKRRNAKQPSYSGCKLEPVYPTNHGYISNLTGKKNNLPVTLTGKKIEAK
jgi:hypothetical protein